MRLLKQFAKATASGFFLVIGCSALLGSGNIYAGAAVFTVALCGICALGLPLYTGAVGFASTKDDFVMLCITLLGNFAGCIGLGILVGLSLPDISASAAALIERRLYPVQTGFVLSFVCGLLMYTAVYTYRIKNSPVGIFTCVPAFILAGFEHSIAYMGFMGIGIALTPDSLLNMTVFIAGNGIGAIVLAQIVKLSTEKKG